LTKRTTPFQEFVLFLLFLLLQLRLIDCLCCFRYFSFGHFDLFVADFNFTGVIIGIENFEIAITSTEQAFAFLFCSNCAGSIANVISVTTHKFVLSFLGSTTSTAAGWQRDLVKEGVESNPGPTFEELLGAISKKFNGVLPPAVLAGLLSIQKNISDAHKNDSNFLYVDSDQVLEYLEKNLDPTSQLAKLLKETIASFPAPGVYLFHQSLFPSVSRC
jgi:hypothetical protein